MPHAWTTRGALRRTASTVWRCKLKGVDVFRMTCAVLLAGLAWPVSAATWIKTSAAVSAEAFVDSDSIQFSEDSRLFWSKLVLVEPRKMSDGSLVQFLKAHVEANCRSGTLALLEVILYTPSGDVARHNENPEEPRVVRKDSLEETQFQFVCHHEGKHL